MKASDVLPAWGRILQGYRPFLSVELTSQCPLHCPGCYAFHPNHVAEGRSLESVANLRGQELIDRVLELVRRFRPLHVSLVGGEPLLRHRELGTLIPALGRMGIEVQLVTSAVVPIPKQFRHYSNLHMVVSVDGLPPEHDCRRAPATYDRILRNIAGHTVIVHCTVTRQTAESPGYQYDFVAFWSAREEVRKIWFSLYTPQAGESSPERLTEVNRASVLKELSGAAKVFPKLYLPDVVLRGYERPARSANACIFAQVTTCISADLTSYVVPCQLGGLPVCSECGCIAAAGLAAIGHFRIGGILPVHRIFQLSRAIGDRFAERRDASLRTRRELSRV